MTWLYVAAALLVAAGLSLGFALLWLRRAAQRRRHVLAELLDLREPLQRDFLAGLAQSGDLILRLGLRGMHWEGHWYGAPIEGGSGDGARDAAVLEHAFAQPDVFLAVRVSVRGLHGEARLFAEQSAQLLFAILEGALAARELALVSSMAQRARVAVFLQHDMRNLTQWVELVAEDFESAASDASLLNKAKRVQKGAASARDRAQRISSALLRPGAGREEERWEPLDLQQGLADAAAMHQVAVTDIPAFPPLRWSAAAWNATLDNVLGNVSRLAREKLQPACCVVRLRRETDSLQVSFDTPDLPLEVPVRRLFEPWVAAAPGGTGLGLYQVRKMVLSAGGELKAEPCGAGLSVTLCIPCKKS